MQNKAPKNTQSNLIQIESQDQKNSLFPYLSSAPDPKLIEEGWQRRFMVGPDRLEETRQLYEELGFEVLNAAVKPTLFNEMCKGCATLACEDYVIIYTRKNSPKEEEK